MPRTVQDQLVEQYAVIGHPIVHSQSPQIHRAFAEQTQQAIVYERLLAPIDALNATVQQFIAAGGRGANITVPFKLEALTLATSLTQRAAQAGAINTLSFKAGEILGDNTDGIGLVRDLVRLGIQIKKARVLILGAGGAAQGIIGPLLEQQPAQLFIVNRNHSKAQHLATLFSPAQALTFTSLAGRAFDIVINATSASLHGEALMLPQSVWNSAQIAYDLMYAATLTTFLQQAQTAGVATITDGLGMLVEQAAESFFIWRGVRPNTAPVLEMLRTSL